LELLDRICKNLNQFEQRQRNSAMNKSAFPAQVYAVENIRIIYTRAGGAIEFFIGTSFQS
jgi:hypothetical protein